MAPDRGMWTVDHRWTSRSEGGGREPHSLRDAAAAAGTRGFGLADGRGEGLLWYGFCLGLCWVVFCVCACVVCVVCVCVVVGESKGQAARVGLWNVAWEGGEGLWYLASRRLCMSFRCENGLERKLGTLGPVVASRKHGRRLTLLATRFWPRGTPT